jgi:hypothetical protein
MKRLQQGMLLYITNKRRTEIISAVSNIYLAKSKERPEKTGFWNQNFKKLFVARRGSDVKSNMVTRRSNIYAEVERRDNGRKRL